jgi:hypothetical protein
MFMRICFLIILFFVSCSGFSQTSFLKDAMVKLDRALVQKDTVTLKQLLHKDVTYGHSNGWVQTKTDVINDLVSGKLVYTKIESKDLAWTVSKDWTAVRSSTKVEANLNGNKLELNLHVLEVWQKTNKGWQLIARQSTKL